MDLEYNKTVLPNGIRVVTEVVPYVKSASIGVWACSGSKDEGPHEHGISHFLEHMVFKGSKNRDAYAIATSLESLGGRLDAFTSREHTCYSARVLDEHIPEAFEVLSDLYRNPVLDPALIDLEKKVVIEEIRNIMDAPDDYIHDLFAQSVWPGHPLGNSISGSEEDVKSFTREMLVNYMHRRYVGERTVIAAAGNINHEQVVELAEHLFPIPRTGESSTQAEMSSKSGGVRTYTRDESQEYVCFGSRGVSYEDPSRYAALLLSSALGGGMSSRLYQSVRERQGLAYSIYTYTYFYQETGIFCTFMAVSPDRVQEAVRLVHDEYKGVREVPLPADEVESVKAQVKGALVFGLENTTTRMNRLARTEVYFHCHVPVSQLVSEVEKVTQEDILEVSRDLLDSSNLCLVLLGPLSEDRTADIL